MTNYFASSLLDAMGKVLHLHTGTCQYLDRHTGWPHPAASQCGHLPRYVAGTP